MSLDTLGEVIKSYKYNSITAEQIESLTIMLQHAAFEPLYPLIISKIKEFEIEDKEIQKKISEKSTKQQNQKTTKPVENIQLTFTLTGFEVTDEPPEPYFLYDPYEESWISSD